MADKYEQYSQEELIRLLRERDRKPRFGLVWERDEIDHDNSLNDDFVVLDVVPELSSGSGPWRNLVIEGDNFDALRYLRMTHAGKVRCIYIDPPYNTGNKDFIYNDRFVDKEDVYKHSKWLEYLYRRLLLARELLAEDGVLLVSINDENRAKLELLLDQVFPGMRLGSFVWRTRQGSNADQACFLSVDHEHILVYGGPGFRFSGFEKSYEMYSNPDNDPRGDWRASDLTLGFSYKERPNLYYPIVDPKTGVAYPANPDRVWVYATKERLKDGQQVQAKTIEEFIELGQILFPVKQKVVQWDSLDELLAAIDAGNVPKTGKTPILRRDLPDLQQWVGRKVGFGRPAFKRYKADLRNQNQPVSSWIVPKFEAGEYEIENAVVSGTNQEGARALAQIFGSKPFNYPKPPSLLKALIAQATRSQDIVLDFFAGSGTTAQAVLEQNKEDGGQRRFILVSSTEATQNEPDKNVCRDVCAVRVSKIIEQLAVNDAFVYLRAGRIVAERVLTGVRHEQVWLSLQLIHFSGIEPFDAEQNLQLAHGVSLTVAYLPRLDEQSATQIAAIAENLPKLVLYSWQPAQLRERIHLPNVVFEKIPEFLVARFGGDR
jgi:adenine-specific DNA-methyltransferase